MIATVHPSGLMGPSVSITREGLQFHGVFFSDHPVARYVLKKDAQRAAQSFGWQASDVSKGFNRFGGFWVIGQQYTTDTYRLLLKDGSTWDVPIGDPTLLRGDSEGAPSMETSGASSSREPRR